MGPLQGSVQWWWRQRRGCCQARSTTAPAPKACRQQGSTLSRLYQPSCCRHVMSIDTTGLMPFGIAHA